VAVEEEEEEEEGTYIRIYTMSHAREQQLSFSPPYKCQEVFALMCYYLEHELIICLELDVRFFPIILILQEEISRVL
jgi:hypothetical protein